MKTKLIFNPKLARTLLHKGFKIVDLKPMKEDTTKSIFVFELTNELLKELN